MCASGTRDTSLPSLLGAGGVRAHAAIRASQTCVTSPRAGAWILCCT